MNKCSPFRYSKTSSEVIPHYLAVSKGKEIENYSSATSAGLALMINLYGCIFGLLGSIMAVA